MSDSPRVIVIGGGITGVSAAYELARYGAQVTLCERGGLASMGSGRTLAGVRQSGRHPAEMPLAMAAVERWQGLDAELDANVEYRQRGNLRLARDEDDVKVIEALVDEQRRLGLDIEFLGSNRDVRALASALSSDILAASYCSTDGHADPVKTVRAFAHAARRHGAEILENTSVTRVTVVNGRVNGVETHRAALNADFVIVAAGIDTPLLTAPLGLDLPISFGFVPVVQTVPRPPLIDQVLGTAKAHFAARQEANGKIRFSGGGQAIAMSPDDITLDAMQPGCARVAETLQRAIEILPDLEHTPVNRVWGGLIDLTPDGIPVLDKVSEIEGLIVAAGFSGHGFCLGPVTGQILREFVIDGESSFPTGPFSWGRFATSVPRAELRLDG